MSDLISRQAAIEAADSIIERDTSGNNDVVKAMTAWKEYIKGMPPAQPGWIPVTEKCPEIGQIVLCSLKTRHYYGRIHVCKYRAADKYYDHSYFDWDHNGFPDVVAWMPLPKPWEGDANDT